MARKAEKLKKKLTLPYNSTFKFLNFVEKFSKNDKCNNHLLSLLPHKHLLFDQEN